MIEFEIDDIEEMYMRLLSPRQKANELEELINQVDDQSSSDLKKRLGNRSLNYESFETGNILLPTPLKYVCFLLSSNGINYRGIALLIANYTDASESEYLEDKAVKEYRNLENAQIIGKNALIVYGTDPFFSIESDYPCQFKVKFGEGGTMKRRLTGIEHFETDISKFVSLVSQFSNGFYNQGNVPNIKYRVYLK